MRKLAPNEKTLFLVLCGVVFFAINLLSLKVFLNAHKNLQSKIATIKLQIAEGRTTIAMGDALKPGTAWIQEHPLPLWNSNQASTELLKTERNEAEKNGLKIIEENLLPPHANPFAESVAVQTKISGSFEGLVKFLFALQNPTAWRAINKFNIKSDSEPTKIIIDFELEQYFRTSSS